MTGVRAGRERTTGLSAALEADGATVQQAVIATGEVPAALPRPAAGRQQNAAPGHRVAQAAGRPAEARRRHRVGRALAALPREAAERAAATGAERTTPGAVIATRAGTATGACAARIAIRRAARGPGSVTTGTRQAVVIGEPAHSLVSRGSTGKTGPAVRGRVLSGPVTTDPAGSPGRAVVPGVTSRGYVTTAEPPVLLAGSGKGTRTGRRSMAPRAAIPGHVATTGRAAHARPNHKALGVREASPAGRVTAALAGAPRTAAVPAGPGRALLGLAVPGRAEAALSVPGSTAIAGARILAADRAVAPATAVQVRLAAEAPREELAVHERPAAVLIRGRIEIKATSRPASATARAASCGFRTALPLIS